MSLPSVSRSLDHNIKSSLHIHKSEQSYKTKKRKTITSSSMSKNDTPRASLIASKVSAPWLATFHPRFSCSLDTHPATPSAQGTENTRLGTRSLFPDTVIMRKSGYPSKLASPSLMGTGKGGFRDVSSTSSEGDRGKREDRGKRMNA